MGIILSVHFTFIRVSSKCYLKRGIMDTKSKKGRPAASISARENQLINYAVLLAEKQLLEGTASAQVITHFLKLGTTIAQLEKEKLIAEQRLLEARAEALAKEESLERLFKEATEAMRSYRSELHDEED